LSASHSATPTRTATRTVTRDVHRHASRDGDREPYAHIDPYPYRHADDDPSLTATITALQPPVSGRATSRSIRRPATCSCPDLGTFAGFTGFLDLAVGVPDPVMGSHRWTSSAPRVPLGAGRGR
jgi:hypothetical protein